MQTDIDATLSLSKTYLSDLYRNCLNELDQNSNVLMDFTSMFKGKIKKKPNKRFLKNTENIDPKNEINENESIFKENSNSASESQTEIIDIPKNLIISQKDIEERRFMNLKRWYCLSRPQYAKSCGISSLVSCWNFLFSNLGEGNLPPISQEYALELLGINPPYKNLDFGKFTGNETLINWFWKLNKIHNVRGWGKIMWKLHGNNKTEGMGSEEALLKLKEGLKDNKKSYIYHCYNHYMCPIGFESTPTKPHLAYATGAEIFEYQEWIIIGEISKTSPVFHVKKWSDIAIDINCQFPEYFNIRKSNLGVQNKKGKEFKEGKHLGGNLHCIIEFTKG